VNFGRTSLTPSCCPRDGGFVYGSFLDAIVTSRWDDLQVMSYTDLEGSGSFILKVTFLLLLAEERKNIRNHTISGYECTYTYFICTIRRKHNKSTTSAQ
jgi:hypothetical protein